MKKFLIAVACGVSYLTVAGSYEVQAQAVSKIGEVKFNEPFNDPDQSMAKDYARIQGLSIEEADAQLKVMNEVSVLIHKLRAKYPDNFSGARAVHTGTFHVEIFFAKLDNQIARQGIEGLGASADLLKVLKVGVAPVSEAAAHGKSLGLLKQLQARGIDGTVAWSAIDDSYKLLVKNPAETATAARMGYVNATENVRIEQFNGIKLANDIIGSQWHDNPTFNNFDFGDCTVGFMVRKIGTKEYGYGTAAHCGDTAQYRYIQQNPSVYYDAPGVQAYVGNGVDFQWHRVNGGPNNEIVPKFWDGQSKKTVTGATSDYEGLLVCKYGITTFRTCGLVDKYAYQSIVNGIDYGYMSRFNNPGGVNMVEGGDSGGPVFSGTLAVGFLHGEDQYDNVYYTSLWKMQQNNIPVSVICGC